MTAFDNLKHLIFNICFLKVLVPFLNGNRTKNLLIYLKSYSFTQISAYQGLLSVTLVIPEKNTPLFLYWILVGIFGVGTIVFLSALFGYIAGYNSAYEALIVFFETGAHESSHTKMLTLVEGGIAEAYDQGLKAGYEVGKDTLFPAVATSGFEPIYSNWNIYVYFTCSVLGLYLVYRILSYLLPGIIIITLIAIIYYFVSDIYISILYLGSSLIVIYFIITTITSFLTKQTKTTRQTKLIHHKQ